MKKSLHLFLLMLLCILSCENSNSDYSGYWVLKNTPDYLIKIDDKNHTIWAGYVSNMPKTQEEADKFILEHEDPLLCSYEERDGAIFAEYWDKPYMMIQDGIVVMNDVYNDNEPVKKLWNLKGAAESVGGWGTESNSGSQSHINSVSGGNNLFSSKADVENYIRGAKFRSKGGDIISFSEQKELVVKPHDKSWEQKLTAPVVVESFSGTTAVLQGKVGNSVLRIDINAAEGTLRQSADKAVVYYNTKNGSQERVNQLKNIITSKEFSHMENDVYSNSTFLHVYVFNSNGSGTVALYRVEPIGRKLISRHDIDWEIDGERLKVYNHDEYGETDYFQISESLFGGYSIKNGNVVYD